MATGLESNGSEFLSDCMEPVNDDSDDVNQAKPMKLLQNSANTDNDWIFSSFEKKHFEIEAPICELVEKSLPKLQGELPSCKITFEKQTLAVVCLTKEIDNVVLKVEGFLEGIKIAFEAIQKQTTGMIHQSAIGQVQATPFVRKCGASTVKKNEDGNKNQENSTAPQDKEMYFRSRRKPVKLKPISSKAVEDFPQKAKEDSEKPKNIVEFLVISSDHIDYLDRTQLLSKTVEQSHPGITEATLVKNENQIRFVGPREQVLAAKQQCNELVKELIVTVLELPTEAMNFVSQRAGLEFIEKCLSDRYIVSVLLVEPKSSVKIVAKSVEEYEKVIECFSDNVRKVSIPLPSKNEHMFTSRKWDEISKTITTEELIDFQINFENAKKSDITLYGAAYLVEKYNKVIQDFIDSLKVEPYVINLPTGIARYLKEKLSVEVERIKAELREEQVKIEIGSGKIDFEGTKDGVDQSKKRIRLLLGEIVSKRKSFSSVGVASLFSNEDGQRNIKGIEASFNVVIEAAKVFVEPAQPQAVRPEQAYEKTNRKLMRASSASMDLFDECNFRTREGLQVWWKYGNIAQERADILVNSATSDLSSPTRTGRALNWIGGPSFIAECNLYTSIGTGEIATTNSGKLRCNSVIHAVCCGWNNSGKPEQILRSLLLKILLECHRENARSVAMPLIGTGKHKFPVNRVLRVMREEFERFSSRYPGSSLKEIKLVRYGGKVPVQTVPVVAYGAARVAPIAKTRSSFVPLVAGSREEAVTLHVYDRSGDDIDSALLEIKKFIVSHITSKKVEDEKAFEVANEHWDELKRLASDGLRIKCIDAKTVSIEGLTSKVTEVKDRVTELVRRFTKQERRSNQHSYISKNIQWYYNDPSNREVAYSATLNCEIEVARMDGKATVEITDTDGYQYDVYFDQMVARNKRNGQTKKLTRKFIGPGADLPIPPSWTPQPATQVVKQVQLSPSSQEYVAVRQYFTSHGGQANQLYSVERIQNPRLYSSFLTAKKNMRNPKELRLFHGTDAANIDSINVNNFSRSFAGVNGTTYGHGVYFARDASYSIRYTKRGSPDHRPKLYMAIVLVGDYTQGSSGMKAPPSKNDPDNPGVLYDSVVDNPSDPSMYVIFKDTQCYPEYLLTLNF